MEIHRAPLMRVQVDGAPLKITTLAVDPIKYRLPSWATFECLIERAIKESKHDHGLSSADAIETLKIKIWDCSTNPNLKRLDQPKYFGIVDSFAGLLRKEMQTLHLGLHPEAVLAVLMKCPPTQILNSQGSALKVLCKVRSMSPCYICDSLL